MTDSLTDLIIPLVIGIGLCVLIGWARSGR